MLVELPDGLAQMTPGPELSAILADIDPRMLHGAQLIELLAARGRQAAYEDGQLLLAARELAYSSRRIAEGIPVRDLKKDPYTNTELAFAMGWSDYRAEAFVGTALSAVDRTPAVLEAMLAGRLDLSKAKVIDSELVDTTDEYARRIVAAILPTVEEYTTAQLRVRIRVLLMKLDPEAARKRHDKALKSRTVEHSEFANGTAMISGMYLPKDVAAAAWSNIDAIAHATNTAGYSYGRNLDEMRADIFGDLLTGTPSNAIPATNPNPTGGDHPATNPSSTGSSGTATISASPSSDDTTANTRPAGCERNATTNTGTNNSDNTTSNSGQTDSDSTATANTNGDDSDGATASTHPVSGSRDATTNTGTDSNDGMTANSGPTGNGHTVTTNTDAAGSTHTKQPNDAGDTSSDHDPSNTNPETTHTSSDDERVVVVRPRRGVINLGIDLTTLACLNDDPGMIPGFGPVLADIARQATHQMAEAAQWRFTVRDHNGDTVAEGRLRAKPDLTSYDPYRPSAAQRAFVNARDKTCRAPGCRRPAIRCDQDHIRDWVYSHETTIANLCCLCRRHHRAKHVGGFRTERTTYGIDWFTPRGGHYTVLSENAPTPHPSHHRLAQYLHGHHTPSKLRR